MLSLWIYTLTSEFCGSILFFLRKPMMPNNVNSASATHFFLFAREMDPFGKFYHLNLSPFSVAAIDISQYRLLFGLFLLYTDRIPFELLDSAALL
jgi:hypothetical protein